MSIAFRVLQPGLHICAYPTMYSNSVHSHRPPVMAFMNIQT